MPTFQPCIKHASCVQISLLSMSLLNHGDLHGDKITDDVLQCRWYNRQWRCQQRWLQQKVLAFSDWFHLAV